MAKTLGKLRTQTLKLKELEPPKDVSKGTKTFVRKHVYVVHPDANENGDDVFKAKNIKRSKRSPDHGYEPGEDEDIYEGAMKDIDTDEKEKKRLGRVKDSVTMKKGRTRGESLKDDHRASRRQEGQRLIDRQRTEETEDLGEMHRLNEKWTNLETLGKANIHWHEHDGIRGKGGRAIKGKWQEKGYLNTIYRRTRRNGTVEHGYNVGSGGKKWDLEPHPDKPGAYRIKNATYMKDETNLDEMRGLATLMAIRAAARAVRNNRPERSKPQKNKRGELLLTPDMQDPKQKAELAGLEAKIGRLAGYKSDMAAATRKKAARDYWGEETEMHINENENVDDRNSEHHYMHSMIEDHLDEIRNMLRKHVSLMDNMNDRHHETHYHKLGKIHDALDSIAEKLSDTHRAARSAMGMNPKPPNEGNHDLAGRPMVGASFPHSEGFEHIAAMSESDQALLVDTYNSLTEENQERFLEIAESEEGCEKLLDFCITSRGND